eukprot:CAMPEP_0179490594 /NCGR_PEP_ID=MMETSP0799-20121207/65544_1 /TAXON_ID=46947 /ORGANISM="Geminigera cryophila, Strain CCMP2564" /LENGTH=138 /DNA_ID=CAMNT_0021306801 /DNA_START=31 /DNA_END=448 /DNA_ORIENTATION=-
MTSSLSLSQPNGHELVQNSATCCIMLQHTGGHGSKPQHTAPQPFISQPRTFTARPAACAATRAATRSATRTATLPDLQRALRNALQHSLQKTLQHALQQHAPPTLAFTPGPIDEVTVTSKHANFASAGQVSVLTLKHS